jgi:hypothetical protein
MMKKHSISITIGLLLAGCLLGCPNVGDQVGVDEKEIQGFKIKTFFNKSENIEVTIASDGKTTIVAIPKRAISRRNQLGDDAYNCLKKCREIEDDEKRVQCIVLCPPNKDYQVFMY